MAGRTPLRILCFGDSLTSGYSNMGCISHPYAEKMGQMLEMAYPHFDLEMVEDGVPGATVKFGFLKRIERHFSRKKDDGTSYFDWSIVLGGTNDLAMQVPPEEIFQHLKAVWDVALSRKCKVLALTVPEAGVTTSREVYDRRRNRLNDLIKGYKREGFHVFDFNAAQPYFAMSESDRERYWDDLIHFTSDGYDRMGNKIGLHLVSILKKEEIAAGGPPTKRRRVFRDDEKVFEEEIGDPHAIDQGWIVVRKKDLD
ncbi:SGNH hydrolase-type esterase domain-containing protein [Podospora didyma]|uniref:SGNH hydrolase-type esterase domain-containing protein n=1 Tax=Podospora didyma TaxID=330526 RepID=A0AAE0P3Z7_9PEZI|nr:SGNH hydrolase-type esterase domain-containing protein [Podospora didyma]